MTLRSASFTGVSDALRMFRLSLTDEPDERAQIVPTGVEQITSPLTDFAYEDVYRPIVQVAHIRTSILRPHRKNPVGSRGLWGNLGRR